ncbi:glycosyltransferase family 4 protein [Catellatospora citrea]|uniref:Glycosyltransferase involved in cell wall biosynthesis n=1 Tax=Catellatospora citrea TaxID=53366 RepID=A0A8J3KLA4_9ACTN|nr:glycosyltransferase family 4 protein [Catellatospora citrea]RKE07892.1 glycosyltransferase involved in cell wall biosynthesis [Catellatospora citrea]GIG02098.1 hypothetical protein Cci01nite_71910 [Catellatospora citrea]
MSAIAFVLVSWRPDAAAGMERAVAAHAAALVAAGHDAVIITAEPDQAPAYEGATVCTLESLQIPRPCSDETLRAAISTAGSRLTRELQRIYQRHRAAAAVYVDALWGLGRAVPIGGHTKPVLAVHVIGHREDMDAALQRAEVVIAPSEHVLRAAGHRYEISGWQVVPNTLLVDTGPTSEPKRRSLRQHGPVRVLARLGEEKGIAPLLAAGRQAQMSRLVEVAVSAAGFESAPGAQHKHLTLCRELANRAGIVLRSGLAWTQVPSWLGSASVVIVPSLAETFGLVALEALAAGTPVVAHDVDNLPALVGDGGIIVPISEGPGGLWRAAGELLADPVRYEQTSRAGYYRSRDYRPALVADLLLKAVS